MHNDQTDGPPVTSAILNEVWERCPYALILADGLPIVQCTDESLRDLAGWPLVVALIA